MIGTFLDDYFVISEPTLNLILSLYVQASLVIDTPMSNKVLSQSSIYPIEKLFIIAANDADNMIPPSRYIISNKTLSLPTMNHLSERAFVSDRTIRMKAMMMESGRNATDETSPLNSDQPIDDKGHRKPDTAGPSEQAKTLLERIPDLSFMLSTTISIPSVK